MPRRRVHVDLESEGEEDDADGYIDDILNSDTRRKRQTSGERVGEKEEWSGDDDLQAAYNSYKNRKSRKRKADAASKKKFEEDNKIGDSSKEGNASKKRKQQEEEETGDHLLEDRLPDYVTSRRSAFDKGLEEDETKTLTVPPKFDKVEFSDDERLKELQERPNFKGISSPCREYRDIKLPDSFGIIPAPIARWLRDYQVKGVAFLHECFVYQKGGILGDDMGLGKTVQVIAFLTVAFGKTGDERDAKRMRKVRRSSSKTWYPKVLVICPGSLIENWKSEFQTWGWWHVDVAHGPSREAAIEAAIAGRLEIMITTYSTYRLNQSRFNMVDWDCVVADECHTIKERSSEITKAMNNLNALCRIGLTGTAIQNNYDELWTILNWTNPGRFGPLANWKDIISKPLKIGQSHNATLYELSRARKTAKKLVENLLPRFFLRRMKSLIADQLPSKSDKVVFCPMTATQKEAYENFLQSEILELIRTATEPCPCGTPGKKKGWCCFTHTADGKKWQAYTFPAIVNLQKLANHLAILIPVGTDGKEKQERDLFTLQTTMPRQWKSLYETRDSIVHFSNPEFCGKWKILKKMLKFWHENGDKVLVFSHSVRLLKMLHMLFNHTSYNVCFLDGSMSYEDRATAVSDFNSDPTQFVFLISTKAGGVGLNITSANKVVIVDPNWNPAYDLQAQDRAYRIGQVRDVEVFRLVSAGTIEEIVYARQIYKQQQANIGYNATSERRYFQGVQENPDQRGEIFGLANLFSFHPTGVLLRDIVNKTNVAEARAGLSVVGVDMAIDAAAAKEDAALTFYGKTKITEEAYMTKLADSVAKGKAFEDVDEDPTIDPNENRKDSNAILAILATAGVEYTHENSEVIGTSAVEKHLSRRAEAAGDQFDQGQNQVFQQSSQITADDDVEDLDNPARPVERSNRPKYKYRPPEDVKERQFCNIAKHFGYDDAVEFALVVESWTQKQRRACLETFYRSRREVLGTGQ